MKNRLLLWLDHHTTVLYLGTIPLLFVLAYFLGDTAVLGAFIATTALSIAGFAAHRRTICAHCPVPENGAEEAEAKRSTLRMFHQSFAYPFNILYVIGPVAVLVVGNWLLNFTVGKGSIGAGMVSILVWYAVSDRQRHIHTKLRPWCPFCRPWDEDELRPTIPTPVGVNSR